MLFWNLQWKRKAFRNINNYVITILINSMKKNTVPFVKQITEQGSHVLTFLWANVIRFTIQLTVTQEDA